MDSGNGYEYTCVPVFYRDRISTGLPSPVVNRLLVILQDNKVSPEKMGYPEAYNFYIRRLYAVPHYGEKSGTELLKHICRCAFHDDVLTEAESISIINICHSPQWYKLWKEMDYNEGWN